MVQDKSKFLQWKFTKSFGAGNPISPHGDIFAFHHISELEWHSIECILGKGKVTPN